VKLISLMYLSVPGAQCQVQKINTQRKGAKDAKKEKIQYCEKNSWLGKNQCD